MLLRKAFYINYVMKEVKQLLHGQLCRTTFAAESGIKNLAICTVLLHSWQFFKLNALKNNTKTDCYLSTALLYPTQRPAVDSLLG